jgi:hypothetical protein
VVAPFRVQRSPRITDVSKTAKVNQELRFYFERLIKMIPAEVIGLYMVGAGVIPPEYPWVLAAWSVVCLFCVVLVRIWGTADPADNLPPQGFPVFASTIAFVIWVYYIGGPFAAFHVHLPWLGSLLVAFWSFVVPIFYRGD